MVLRHTHSILGSHKWAVIITHIFWGFSCHLCVSLPRLNPRGSHQAGRAGSACNLFFPHRNVFSYGTLYKGKHKGHFKLGVKCCYTYSATEISAFCASTSSRTVPVVSHNEDTDSLRSVCTPLTSLFAALDDVEHFLKKARQKKLGPWELRFCNFSLWWRQTLPKKSKATKAGAMRV